MGYQSQLSDAQPKLKKFISSRIFDHSDAHDVLQETNLVVINKERDYDSSKSFVSWIFGIARFQIKPYLKRRQRNKINYVPEYKDTLSQHLDNSKTIDHSDPYKLSIGCGSIPINYDWLADAPFADLIKEERIEFLRQLENYLGNKEKIIFNLLVDGFDCHEIAEKTGFKVTNVTVAKSRIIKKIKKLIKERQEK